MNKTSELIGELLNIGIMIALLNGKMNTNGISNSADDINNHKTLEVE